MTVRSMLRALVLTTAFTLHACTTLPSATPFAEATAQLRGAVVASGTTVSTMLGELEASSGAGPTGDAGASGLAAQFDQQWATRVAAMDAVLDYADALQGIVSAAGQAGSSVEALSGSLQRLAAGVGIDLPGAGTIAAATDIAKTVADAIANARAASSLESALEASQPVIDRIAGIIADDLDDAAAIQQLAEEQLRGKLHEPHQVALGFRQGILAERATFYARSVNELDSDARARLRELDDMLAATDSWYLPLQAQERELEDRLRAGDALLAAAADGVRQWARSHAELVTALAEGRQVSSLSLIEHAADIRFLLQRVREL